MLGHLLLATLLRPEAAAIAVQTLNVEAPTGCAALESMCSADGSVDASMCHTADLHWPFAELRPLVDRDQTCGRDEGSWESRLALRDISSDGWSVWHDAHGSKHRRELDSSDLTSDLRNPFHRDRSRMAEPRGPGIPAGWSSPDLRNPFHGRNDDELAEKQAAVAAPKHELRRDDDHALGLRNPFQPRHRPKRRASSPDLIDPFSKAH